MCEIENLYHVHRMGNKDELWYVGNTISIDCNYQTQFYFTLLEEEKNLQERYYHYDLDYLITTMEEMLFCNLVEDDYLEDFQLLLNRYYFLRREKALEEGRRIYAPDAPSRYHSLFLTDKLDLAYWIKCVGKQSYQVFFMELDGNIFVSSDFLFPNVTDVLEKQVEDSKNYWRPKVKSLMLHEEVLFQGNAQIKK